MSFQLAHFSDTHLGYEAFKAESNPEQNERGADIVKAFYKTIDAIIERDPPVVICSGDVFDIVMPDVNYLQAGQLGFQKLCGMRKDGTRRQVIVISGNHDQPRSVRKVCVLELFSGIPGLHIVTKGYKKIYLDPTLNPKAELADPVLKNAVVHCLPHDSLKHLDDYEVVAPEEDKVNILTTHGVAEGSDLFIRAQGREFPISTDLMLQDWDYVALGHWHKQGPVALSGGRVKGDSKAWYAGSTENISFRDVKGGAVTSTEKGWLLVTVQQHAMPKVEIIKHRVRTMIRLAAIDVTDVDVQDIPALLKKNLKGHNILDAVVTQPVVEANRETWSLVDVKSVQRAAADTLHYEVQVKYRNRTGSTESEEVDRSKALDDLLTERAKLLIPEKDREAVVNIAKKFLGSELDKVIDETEPKKEGQK